MLGHLVHGTEREPYLTFATNELVRKRLAKLMALRCFRNTKLEDLHACILPELGGWDSDVNPTLSVPYTITDR